MSLSSWLDSTFDTRRSTFVGSHASGKPNVECRMSNVESSVEAKPPNAYQAELASDAPNLVAPRPRLPDRLRRGPDRCDLAHRVFGIVLSGNAVLPPHPGDDGHQHHACCVAQHHQR